MNKMIMGAMALVLVLPAAAFAEGDRENDSDVVRGGPRSMVVNDVVTNNEPGLLVTGIVEDSPAESAGIMRGDIILEVNGTEVNTTADLQSVLAEMEAGDVVDVLVSRGGEEMTVDVTLETRLYRPVFGIVGGGRGGISPQGRGQASNDPRGYGMQPRNFGNGQREMPGPGSNLGDMYRFQFSDEDFPGGVMPAGAIVRTVVEDSPAEAAEIQPGDIIVRVGDTTLDDLGVGEAVASLEPGDTVEIEIYRFDGEDGMETVTLETTLTANDDGKAYLGIGYMPFRHPMMDLAPRFPLGSERDRGRAPVSSM